MKHAVLNLNGDTFDSLRAELTSAHEAVTEAMRRVQALTIHGRNYCDRGGMTAATAFAQDRLSKQKCITAMAEADDWIVECMVNLNNQRR